MDEQQKSGEQVEQPQNAHLFNPNEHLIQLKGRGGSADYLPVQWRLVWFRSLCPNGTIETEIVHLDPDRATEEETFAWNNETRRSEKVVKRAPGFAVFRATVRDGRGGIATGTKSERAASFSDYIEKAETGAIGRALAALGYGTQFAGDEFDERHRIVDAPVERASVSAVDNHDSGARGSVNGKARGLYERSGVNGSGSPANGSQKPVEESDSQGPMTEQQHASIRKLCQHLGKAEPESAASMSYLAAKELIMQLSQEYRQSRSKAS